MKEVGDNYQMAREVVIEKVVLETSITVFFFLIYFSYFFMAFILNPRERRE